MWVFTIMLRRKRPARGMVKRVNNLPKSIFSIELWMCKTKFLRNLLKGQNEAKKRKTRLSEWV